MLTAPILRDSSDAPFAKRAGTEPIPGYVLLEPLGRGGFGEVWKCEAPGGLHKAIKFVGSGTGNGDAERLRREYEAFQQVKAIRHPFLLCLERVELAGGELVMVMGLADQHLGDRFDECRADGLSGVPRDELIGYLREAAEALDMIGNRYGLQHLDVKPANLFLTAGHLQVGDYGLVSQLRHRAEDGGVPGFTPRYASPEVLNGRVHARSDQYSLALVYHELLTGTFPFTGISHSQLAFQHASVMPDLGALPECDRRAVAAALAKHPEERFTSCREFVDALACGRAGAPRLSPEPTRLTSDPGVPLNRHRSSTPSPEPPQVGAGATARLPRLVGVKRPHPPTPETSVPPVPPLPPSVSAPPCTMTPPEISRQPFLVSVLPTNWLLGRDAPDPDRSLAELVRALLDALPPTEPSGAGAIVRLADGSWSCRFLTTIDPRIARLKLDVLWDTSGATQVIYEKDRVVFRQDAPSVAPPSGLFRGLAKKQPSSSPSGFEVVVRLPVPGVGAAEILATACLFGSPPPAYTQTAAVAAPAILDRVRELLNNFSERRASPRRPASFSITLFPAHPDGRIEQPLHGCCLDVSSGGVAVRVGELPTTNYAYLAFDDCPEVRGQAILLELVRKQTQNDGHVVAGRYRADLGSAPPE